VNLSNSELDTDSLELNLTNVITMGESSAFLQVLHSPGVSQIQDNR
jgi:hypothetical protein